MRERLHAYTPAQLLGPESATADGEFWSVVDLVTLLHWRYQIRYRSPVSYRTLLRQCGFSYQRSQMVFRPRSSAKVVEFEAQIKKLMDLAQKAPQTVTVAADEAYLYLRATLARVWAPIGQTSIVATQAGREKVNFCGTLNLHTGSVVAQCMEKMKARTTAPILSKFAPLSRMYPSCFRGIAPLGIAANRFVS